MLDAPAPVAHTVSMKGTPTLIWAADLAAGTEIRAGAPRLRHLVLEVSSSGDALIVETFDCLGQPDILIFHVDELVEVL